MAAREVNHRLLHVIEARWKRPSSPSTRGSTSSGSASSGGSSGGGGSSSRRSRAVISDAEGLSHGAERLREYRDYLGDLMADTESVVDEAGQVWRDDQYHLFRNDIEILHTEIKVFMEVLTKQSEYLDELAQGIRKARNV